MNSGVVVVDISSDDDDEVDIYGSDNNFESICQWINNGFEVDVNNNIVDVDKYLLPVVNYDSLEPKSRSEKDESDDDCMILDGDPEKLVEVTGDDKRNDGDGSDDLQIVGQKGQVACRDFPHSRHLCANFPFNTTSHEKHCNLCHCFVCDSPAPCIDWRNGNPSTDHCHATDKDESWKHQRKAFKKHNMSNLPPKKPVAFKLQLPSPPVQNPSAITSHTQIPIRPCSTATSTIHIDRHHRNHRRLIRTLPTSKENHHGLVLSQTISHAQYKRVGVAGSGLTSSSMNRTRHTNSVPNQMHRHALKASLRPRPIVLPRTQSMPPQRSLYGRTASTATDNSGEILRDMLAGVAEELGVSESLKKSTHSCPPYMEVSHTPASGTVNSNQAIQLHTDLESTAISSNSRDFDPYFFSTTDQNPSSDINFESYLVAEEEIAFMPANEINALPEVDPASFLYAFEDWNSTYEYDV